MTDTPADIGRRRRVCNSSYSSRHRLGAEVPIHTYTHQGKYTNCIHMSRYMYMAVVSLIHLYEFLDDNVDMVGVNEIL
jgi:hypothetical protein